MSRDLTNLSLAKLIALACQNKVVMEHPSKRVIHKKFLLKELNALEIIKGLETKEYGHQEVA